MIEYRKPFHPELAEAMSRNLQYSVTEKQIIYFTAVLLADILQK